jgi:hypothetical protein
MLLTAILVFAPVAAQNPIDATLEPGFQAQASSVLSGNFSRATSACDDFNRADSPSMGPDWLEQAGDIEVLANEGHGVMNMSMMSHTGASGNYVGSTMSARFDTYGGLVYVAMVAGFADTGNNIFVKVQDNNIDGLYDRVFFYFGNNGGSWGGTSYYSDLATPTVSGTMTLYFDVSGDIAYLDIDNDASGLTETFSNDGLLGVAGFLGTGYGVGTYGSARFDDVDINDGCGGGTPTYTLAGLVGGGTATITITNATPLGSVLVGYSLAGAGPTMTPYGLVDMSPPISVLPTLTADAGGTATMSTGVPLRATGWTVYTQGVDIGSGLLTNSLAQVVL